MPILRLTTLFTSCLFLLTACGGGDPGPKPLQHHMDDMHIAQVPVEEKREVIEAQQAYSVAKMEYAKAMADYDEIETRLDVAKNQRKQSLLEEKSAGRKLERAEDSADLNRVNAAKRELRAAELSRKAADEKVEYLKKLRQYYKKYVRYTEEEKYHQEARYELAKAKLAKRKNIRPRGFEYERFDSQAKERSRRAQQAQQRAKEKLAEAKARKKKWQGLKKEAARMRGGGSGSSSGTSTSTDTMSDVSATEDSDDTGDE